MEKTCSDCGSTFVKISGHWRQSSCSRPSFTDRQMEIIEGLMLGDGGLRHDIPNAHMKVKSVVPEYLEWLHDEFGVISNGVKFERSAEDVAEDFRERGFYDNATVRNCNDIYNFRTMNHPVLNKYKSWYGEDGLRFPDDVELTPLKTKMWYVSDGSLNDKGTGRPNITFIHRRESDRGGFLESLFESIGLSPIYNKDHHNLWFGVDDTEELLAYMGDPLPGFEYKWD